MNIDHKGQSYSIATDDEDRFEFLIKQIKNEIRQGTPDLITYYESLLDEEFSQHRHRSWN